MRSCPKCSINHEDDVLACDCGYTLFSQTLKKISSSLGMAIVIVSDFLVLKYDSLRTISFYFNLLAGINLIVSFFADVFMLKNVAFLCIKNRCHFFHGVVDGN